MPKRDEIRCEVCGNPIEPGEAVVLGQETARVELSGVLGPGVDGRLAMFHEEHWPERVGEWLERDRGHATDA